MNSLSFVRIHNRFTIFSRSYYEFTIFANKLGFSRFTINLLSFWRIHYKFTVFIANKVRIHLMFPKFTIISVGVSRIHFEFTINFADSLWIHFFSWIDYRFTINSLTFSVFIANFVRIHVMIREFTLILLDLPRIHYLFTIFIVDSSRNHLVTRKLTINSLFISRFH